MDRIQRFLSWWTPAVAGTAVALTFLLRDWLINKGVSSHLALLVLAGVMFLIVRLGETTAKGVLSLSRPFRRLVFGDLFVEGQWLNVCLDRHRRTIRAISVLVIKYENGSLVLGGDVYRCSGGMEAKFDSLFTAFRGRDLIYIYKRRSSRHESTSPSMGRGELCFSVSIGPPKSYTGEFFDPETKTQINIEGKKVTKQLRKRYGIGKALNEHIPQILDLFREDLPDFRIEDINDRAGGVFSASTPDAKRHIDSEEA